MLHFSIFCVFICEGWDTLAKKAVYTPWEGKFRHFSEKRGIYALGAKKLKIFSSVLQKATYVAGRGLKK